MKDVNLSPIGSNLLLELIEEKLSDVIHIPESAKKNRQQTIARVIAVGPRVKAEIKSGDVILAGKYADKVHGPMADLGDGMFIAPESEILAILEGYNEDK